MDFNQRSAQIEKYASEGGLKGFDAKHCREALAQKLGEDRMNRSFEQLSEDFASSSGRTKSIKNLGESHVSEFRTKSVKNLAGTEEDPDSKTSSVKNLAETNDDPEAKTKSIKNLRNKPRDSENVERDPGGLGTHRSGMLRIPGTAKSVKNL